MAVIRHNILKNAAARDAYVRGVMLLKNEFPGPTTASLGIPGPSQSVSTWDLFVVWHHTAMMTMTPPTQNSRNAAHRGPVFPAWHRFMLYQLELNLQRVINDDIFGLPYWDWAADGKLPPGSRSTPKFGPAIVWEAQARRSRPGRSFLNPPVVSLSAYELQATPLVSCFRRIVGCADHWHRSTDFQRRSRLLPQLP